MAIETSGARWGLWSRSAGDVVVGVASGRDEAGRWPCVDLRPTASRGATALPVDGEWPDWPELERWVVAADVEGRASHGLHAALARWAAVLWAVEGADSLAWLQGHGMGAERTRRATFVGPSVSSLWESLEALLAPVGRREPHAVQAARRAARGFAPDPGDRRLDDLAGVPAGRVREQAGRLREEVRRLFGAELDRARFPDTGAPFLVVRRR